MNSSSKVNHSPSLLAIITAGLITGVLQVVLSSSYAALIYGGTLSPYLGQGIGFALIGAFTIATIITIFAARPGTVGSNQDVSVAIFSLISVSIVASMPAHATAESAFCTVVIAIAVTVLLTGIFFWFLGSCHLGGLIRYFPYPVIGGFLAGTGWLLFKGGFSLNLGPWNYSQLLQPNIVIHWLPSIIFASLMLVAVKHVRNSCILPGFIILGICFFYGSAFYFDFSPKQLSDGGWLLGPFPDQTLWQPFTLAQFTLVDWKVIASQTANIVTVFSVSSVALLLNASAFELESKEDVDLDRELRLAGIANLFSCLSPGFVGFRQLCLTVLNYRMQSQSRLVGLIGATIIVLTLFFGVSIISYFPKAIMGGLLMYLGLTFLVEWAYESWKTLPIIDCVIIWLVLLVIATVGFMPGVGVGLLAAVIMFVISYSRTEVVRHELTGETFQSLSSRRYDQRQLLEAQGQQLYILQLQGFIFFGTANRLYNKIRFRLLESHRMQPRFIVLDFQRVDILDSTGMLSFKKIKDVTNGTDTHLIITAPSTEIKNQLSKGGLHPSHPLTHYFSNLNVAVEWCEEQILRNTVQKNSIHTPLAEQLGSILPQDIIQTLLQHMHRLEIAPDTVIIKKGEPAEDFFFIESGTITNNTNGSIDSCLHLESTTNIRVISNIGFYTPHSRIEDIISAEKCVVYRLPVDTLRTLENENPGVTSELHQIMVRLLAERVNHLIKTVSALEK